MDLLSERNSVHKHHNGVIYQFHRMISEGRASWRCPQKGCKGIVNVDNEGEMREINEHDHVVNSGLLEAKIAVTQIRQRAANSRDPPRLLVQQAQATLSNEALAEMPQYNSLQRNVQRKRKINGDPIANPRNIEEIVIPNSRRQTLRGDNFLLYNSGVEDAD